MADAGERFRSDAVWVEGEMERKFRVTRENFPVSHANKTYVVYTTEPIPMLPDETLAELLDRAVAEGKAHEV